MVSTQSFFTRAGLLLALTCLPLSLGAAAGSPSGSSVGPPRLVRSAKSGPWSTPATWEGGKLPTPGARVQIRTGHRVLYDLNSDQAIRSIHVAGSLAFAPDRDTRLDVGLIKIQPGDDASEDGFDCDAHQMADAPAVRPVLEVGTPDRPVEVGKTALIRLVHIDGMDRESCP